MYSECETGMPFEIGKKCPTAVKRGKLVKTGMSSRHIKHKN